MGDGAVVVEMAPIVRAVWGGTGVQLGCEDAALANPGR